LAELYEKLERYEQAVQMREEALSIFRATNAYTVTRWTYHSTLNPIHSLAKLYNKLERYKEAEQLWKEMLAIHEATGGYINISTQHAIRSLSILYQKFERYEEAEQLWRKTLASHRMTKHQSWEYSIDDRLGYFTVEALDSLSKLCEKLGRHEESERLKVQDVELMYATPIQAGSVSEHEDNNPSESGEAPASDPGGDPTYSPPSPMPSASLLPRFQSPFTMRAAFGNKLNSWSMF